MWILPAVMAAVEAAAARLRCGSERGATAIEYAFMVALIAMVVIAAVMLLGETLADAFDCVVSSLSNPGSPC